MAAFRRANAKQAAIKMGLYGLSGSGKTFTALLCAEGLAKHTGKRIAFVDTERGTDFYCKTVPTRRVHPDAFDFDALYTRAITETLEAVRSIDPGTYSVLVIDSITHIWEAARAAYAGKLTKVDTIPFHAWAKIKKPYKELMTVILSSPLHVFICGRQGTEYAEDDETGELKAVGVKMKAEGETPYEPHLLLRMEAIRPKQAGEAVITAYAEKDRTGVLAGRVIEWPKFDSLVAPILSLLTGEQAKINTEDETSAIDAEALDTEDRKRTTESERLLRVYRGRLDAAQTAAEVKAISTELTPDRKKAFLPAHLNELRDAYLEADARTKTGGPEATPDTKTPQKRRGRPPKASKQNDPKPKPEDDGKPIGKESSLYTDILEACHEAQDAGVWELMRKQLNVVAVEQLANWNSLDASDALSTIREAIQLATAGTTTST